MSDTVNKVEAAAKKRLGRMVIEAINKVESEVGAAAGSFSALTAKAPEVVEAFTANLEEHFDDLLDRESNREAAVFNFETLSLVQEEELDVMVALEGMVNAARNEHLAVFISFNTRLSTLLPGKRVDESTNPLDPEQVAAAFQDAMRPVGLDAKQSLTVYRAFNSEVLKQLNVVLGEVNQILIDEKVIPDLSVEAANPDRAGGRSVERIDPHGFGSVEEEPHAGSGNRPEVFSVMQNLLHPGEGAAAPEPVQPAAAGQYMVPAGMVPAGGSYADGAMQPFQPAEGQKVEMVDQATLLSILTDIQSKVSSMPHGKGATDEHGKLDISQSLGEILSDAQDDEGVISAVDRQSSDIINLVTLLYEAIWQDPSVPIPIKELIGRTQITVIKVALADVDFFNNENHPARAILNEYASAGIGWSEVDDLGEDPLYGKISEQVNRILTEYELENTLFEDLLREFKSFMAHEVAKTRQLEQRILKADERQERLDDIRELVTQKIAERVLGRELEPFIEELLNGPYHKFMVMLVLKEGPGSTAWKQAINTIDVLLWSVQPHEHSGDRKRLDTVNPRLLNNLRKAFRIAQEDPAEIDELILQLERVQQESFGEKWTGRKKTGKAQPAAKAEAEDKPLKFLAASDEDEAPQAHSASEEPAPEVVGEDDDDDVDSDEDLQADDPHMVDVDNMSVGVWVEFIGEEGHNTRCKLAAKINAIDKFIFVNRQGVKVVEKTKMGLAKELRDGTVKIISDSALFSRALESVIGNLREHQHEQHTASAYQPQASQSAEGQ